MSTFDYNTFTTRNLGFVNEEEQLILKSKSIFIPGVGGMGGTLLELLARVGIENFIIADMDTFEISNLNRQIFSSLDSIGKSKVDEAKNRILKINPNIKIKTYDHSWVNNLNEILDEVDLIVNGCDDIKSTILLMRTAKLKNKIVIDGFASVLPSVYVVRPEDPRPEEMFSFPTVGLSIDDIHPEIEKKCSALEIKYVLIHSSSASHVVLKYAAEMISGKRKRISFAPMVWGTSILMSYEVVKILLNKKTSVSYKGIFMNPWTHKFERPLCAPFAFFKKIIVNIFLNKLGSES